jgi:hypothetical protein
MYVPECNIVVEATSPELETVRPAAEVTTENVTPSPSEPVVFNCREKNVPEEVVEVFPLVGEVCVIVPVVTSRVKVHVPVSPVASDMVPETTYDAALRVPEVATNPVDEMESAEDEEVFTKVTPSPSEPVVASCTEKDDDTEARTWRRIGEA